MSNNKDRYSSHFDIGLGLEGTHVLITGGCGLIGRVVVQAFLAAGANVSVLDLLEDDPASSILGPPHPHLKYLQSDVCDAPLFRQTWDEAESAFGTVECCIALASLDLSSLDQYESIADMEPARWQDVFDVNLSGTFLTAHEWLRRLRAAVQSGPAREGQLRNVGMVLMGSESGTFGVRTQPAYAAGKAAVQAGLLRSLAQDAPRVCRKARVNAIAPGAVDTARFREESGRYGEQWRYEESEATVALGRPVPPEDVARTILMLASDRFGGSVCGQCIAVDGGKMGSMMWRPGEVEQGSS